MNATPEKLVWTPVTDNKGRVKRMQEPYLVGARIVFDKLRAPLPMVKVVLKGDLRIALADLQDLAKSRGGKNLPIASLRTLLAYRLNGVVSVHRELGVRSGDAAAEIYDPGDDVDTRKEIRELVARSVSRWVMNDLLPWAERNEMGDVAIRVKKAISASAVDLVGSKRYMVGGESPSHSTKVDYPMLARHIGERLAGQELFPALGRCELIVSPDAESNRVELMTRPYLDGASDTLFSMVAKIGVVSLPYSNDVYLRVGVAKRVWCKNVPRRNSAAPSRVGAYVLSPGRPILTVPAYQGAEGWEFREEYQQVQADSDRHLPTTLAKAIERRVPDDSGYWVGLPELTTMFSFVSQRSTFEGDEIELFEKVADVLGDIVQKGWPKIVHRPPRISPSKVPMLDLSDVGLAGASLQDEENTEEGDDDAESRAVSSAEALDNLRKQNKYALGLIHGAGKPVLWVFGAAQREADIITGATKALFGDAVTVKFEVLPEGTHGCRADLEASEEKAVKRFDARVKRWEPATTAMAGYNGPRYALICAAAVYNNKPEDPVNYYAGIHAMASIAGANVHHVLPLADGEDGKAMQHFLHRLQSALMDMFFAHAGVVFSAGRFLRDQYGDGAPKGVYGIQVVRSRAKSFSGESHVNFIVFSRLDCSGDDGKTEVRFFYRAGTKNDFTKWMALADGLRWLGQQRKMNGDENWLKKSFFDSVKEFVGDVAESDPRAIVLVDWGTTRRLWPGIRDEDLSWGAPAMLDAINLSRFCPDMTFVRLRTGADTLSLRAVKRTVYEGFLEGESLQETGELHTELYATTTKYLIETSMSADQGRRSFGHFIASMGYRKTVQLKRGLSCYRHMPRMMKMGTDNIQMYKLDWLAPSKKDAALPASMEITVMHTPLKPETVAAIVTGLRLGYAHFPDWTALPAPLFFKRKIEDYIIRYPDKGGDDSEDAVAVPDAPEPLISGADAPSIYIAALERQVLGAQQELALVVPSEQSPASQDPAEVVGEVSGVAMDDAIDSQHNEPEREPDGNTDPEAYPADRLAEAKRLVQSLIVLYGSADHKARRLYEAMIRDKTIARVIVKLPYFVTPSALALQQMATDSHVKKNIWRRYMMVSSDRRHMPTTAEFPKWMIQKLEVPQSAWCIMERGSFLPIHHSWKAFVEETGDAVATLSPREIDHARLTKWLCERKDNHTLAWMIVNVAQWPGKDNARVVIDAIPDGYVGDHALEAALEYFINCALACREAFENRHLVGKGFPKVIKFPTVFPPEPQPLEATDSHQETPYAAGTAAEREVNALTTADTDVAAGGEVAEAAPSALELEDKGEFMQAKTQLKSLIDGLMPGAESFAQTMDSISALLDSLAEFHRQNVEERERVSREREAVESERRELINRASRVCESIVANIPDISGGVRLVDEAAAAVEVLRTELPRVEALVAAVIESQQHVESIDKVPVSGSTPLERAANKRRMVDKAFAEVEAAIHGLKGALATSGIFARAETYAEYEDAPEDTAPDESVLPSAPKEAALVVKPDPISAHPSVPSALPAAEEFVPAASTPDSSDAAGMAAPTAELAQPAVPVVAESDMVASATDAECVGQDGEPAFDALAVINDFEVVIDSTMLDPHIPPLRRLLEQRRYALAKVHLDAIASLKIDDCFHDHLCILSSATRAIEVVDGHFDVASVLDDGLASILSERNIESFGIACNEAIGLGVLAASLMNMLFEEPGSTPTRWHAWNRLQARFVGKAGLRALVNWADKLQAQAIPLSREAILAARVGPEQAASMHLNRLRERAKDWHAEKMIITSVPHQGFRAINEAMFRDDYCIGKCIAAIAKGDPKAVASAYEEARKKLEKPNLAIGELMQRVNERKRPDGAANRWLVQNIEHTRKFVEEYLEVAKRIAAGGKPASPQKQMLSNIYADLDAALSEAEAMEFAKPIELTYRDLALALLKGMKRLFNNDPPAPCETDAYQLLLVDLPLDRKMQPSMWNRVDDVDVAPACDPSSVLDETSRLSMNPAVGRDTLVSAAREHLDANRILPARMIDELLGKPVGRDSLQVDERAKQARAQLQSQLQVARQRVTTAMLLQAMQQAEANVLLRKIEDILELCAPRSGFGIGDLRCESVQYPDFPHAFTALREQVLKVLNSRMEESKAKLKGRLTEYEEKNSEVPGAARNIARVKRFLDSDSASSIRSAHDAMDLLESGNLPTYAADDVSPVERYRIFLHELETLPRGGKSQIESLKQAIVAEEGDKTPAWVKQLSADQKDQAVRLIDTWIRLCTARNNSEADAPLSEFFHMLGLGGDPVCIPPAAASRRLHFMFEKSCFVGIRKVFVPPELGSTCKHVQGYILPNKAQEREFNEVIVEYGQTSPTFVMGRATLGLQQRVAMGNSAKAIIIDDNLVAFLAVHPEERAERLLEIALLSFRATPYDDYPTSVPSEMFFGRKEELEKLRNLSGMGLLFGGRRLGKSSLLEQIKQDLNKNQAAIQAGFGEVAIPITLDVRLDPAAYGSDYLSFAWRSVYNAMISEGFIPSPKGASAPNTEVEIRQWLEKEIGAGKARTKSCYLLVDEADAVMERGLHEHNGSKFVDDLQGLCDRVRSKCNIRYVIAGLHNLKRMTTQVNSALGKATSISLEPFTQKEIREGYRLIKTPMAALGFHFTGEAEDLPLRIMAVCNFYPAFIQLYCRTLLASLYNRRQNAGTGEIQVTESDLDGVESQEKFLKEMQELFRLNLNLDKRYKAIALILAEDHYLRSESGGQAGLEIEELSFLCNVAAEKHFANTGPGAMEALLDEMCKLTVLDKVGSRYQLRTPHIAILLGDLKKVRHDLKELEMETPPSSRSLGESRIYMKQGKDQILFPMPSAWLRGKFDPLGRELLVIVGNLQSGIREISNSKLRGQWDIGSDQRVVYEARNLGSVESARSTLMREAATSNTNRLVAIAPSAWRSDDIPAFADIAAMLVDAKKDRGIRLALLTTPDSAYDLACRITSGRIGEGGDGSGRRWQIARIPEWNDDALFFSLNGTDHLHIRDNGEARAAILDATCGFTKFVEKACRSGLSVEKACESFTDALEGYTLDRFHSDIGTPAVIPVSVRRKFDSVLAASSGADLDEVVTYMGEEGLDPALLTFYQWMGLVHTMDGKKLRLPRLYRELIEKEAA